MNVPEVSGHGHTRGGVTYTVSMVYEYSQRSTQVISDARYTNFVNKNNTFICYAMARPPTVLNINVHVFITSKT